MYIWVTVYLCIFVCLCSSTRPACGYRCLRVLSVCDLSESVGQCVTVCVSALFCLCMTIYDSVGMCYEPPTVCVSVCICEDICIARMC